MSDPVDISQEHVFNEDGNNNDPSQEENYRGEDGLDQEERAFSVFNRNQITSVTFTGGRLRQTFNRPPDKTSREALGVWFHNREVWKIMSQRGGFQRVRRDYDTAAQAGLPIGNVIVEQGDVQYTQSGSSRPHRSQGFVVQAPLFSGEFFQGAAAFRTALNRLRITQSSDEYRRLVRDCTTARTLGLQDCQGFVRATTTYIRDPINFTDIHLAPNRPQAAQALLDVLSGLPQRRL